MIYKLIEHCEGKSYTTIINTDNKINNNNNNNNKNNNLSYFALSNIAFIDFLFKLFLPIDYPNSVTPDYLSFQIYDTIQAVSSYLRGLLCTQALLTGLGVGKVIFITYY